MKQSPESPGCTELEREVEALRKRIESLESGQVRPNAPGRAMRSRWLTKNALFALAGVVVTALLVFGVPVARSAVQALFIAPSGNVGIGTDTPTAKLDVKGDASFSNIGINHVPISSQNLLVVPNSGNVPFNVTNPANTDHWLTVLSDGKVVMNGGNVGIGTDDPKAKLDVAGNETVGGNLDLGNSALYFTKTDHNWSAAGDKEGQAAIENSSDFSSLKIAGRSTPDGRVISMWDRVGIWKTDPKARLDVRGEIRGKLWSSKEYEWHQGEARTRMTKTDRSTCFLTYVRGHFAGEVKQVGIIEASGYWYLEGSSAKESVAAKARCIGAPDDSW